MMDLYDLIDPASIQFSGNFSNATGNVSFGNYDFSDWNLDFMGKSDSEYQKDLLMYYLMGIGGMLVCSLGIIGNILSIIVLNQKVMRSSTYSYLSALAFSDTFFLFFTILLLIKDTKKPVMDGISWTEPYYVRMFPIVHPAAVTFQVTSIWLTLSFTVDRYIMICHPFKAERWCSVSRARKVIVCLVIAGILYNLPRFFEYKAEEERFAQFNDIENVTLFENFTLPSKLVIKLTDFGSSKSFREVIHSWLYFICVAGVPFLALAVLNTFLIVAVHKSRKKGLQLKSKDKRRNDTTIMLIGVIVIFLICQGPALVSRMIWALHFEAAFRSLPWYTFSEISNFLVIINSAINIVPYYFFGKKFRRQFWRLFCSCLLTKEEIRRLARSLSITLERRGSNMSQVPAQELKAISQRENYNSINGHKNRTCVPLIGQKLPPDELTIPKTHTPDSLPSYESCVSGDLANIDEPKKLLVNLEANGNLHSEIKHDYELSYDKCHNNNAIL